MSDNINANVNPTSEVGSASPPAMSADQWRAMVELQNRNFIEMCKIMQASVRQTTDVVLPKFNPEANGADATQWCATASIVMNEQQIDGSALIMMLSSCMEGSASAWHRSAILASIGSSLRSSSCSVLRLRKHRQLCF